MGEESGDCNHNVRIFQRRPSAFPLLGEGQGEGEPIPSRMDTAKFGGMLIPASSRE